MKRTVQPIAIAADGALELRARLREHVADAEERTGDDGEPEGVREEGCVDQEPVRQWADRRAQVSRAAVGAEGAGDQEQSGDERRRERCRQCMPAIGAPAAERDRREVHDGEDQELHASCDGDEADRGNGERHLARRFGDLPRRRHRNSRAVP